MVDKNGKYCSSQRCDHCHHADGTVQMHHNYIPVDAATCNRLGISNTSRAYGTRVSWDEQYEQLKVYKREHGNCNVPQKYEADEKLGRWVDNQRNQLKNYDGDDETKLERINRLNSLDFEWGTKKKTNNAKQS
ncbi:hypothetical protein ACHAWO_010381 [Cyclotella atomus]|uniref:Helicase-associated domain-containing protein n=1 Tax=Cyclotella atomus TaxID=382360 RepID=A0ABD3QS24_9STRA